MTDIKRRGPQPQIDPAKVAPGSRWQKNRAEDIGKPPIVVVVDHIQFLADERNGYDIVHYWNEATLRRGKMPLKDFCAGSEHREPDPLVEEAPVSGTRETVERPPVDMHRLNEMVQEIHAILTAPGQRSLPMVGAR